MKDFTCLFNELASEKKPNEKVHLVLSYLQKVTNEDKIQMLALFTGRKPKRIASPVQLREWVCEATNIPLWLFDECYKVTSDHAETISLLLPKTEIETNKSLAYWINYLKNLEDKKETELKKSMIEAWMQLNTEERFVFTKIASSSFKVSISQSQLVNALCEYTGQNSARIIHQLMQKWNAEIITFNELLRLDKEESDSSSQPYPFCSAKVLEGNPNKLGNPKDWIAEWERDGIRVQFTKRNHTIYIWSEAEELLTDKLPELKLLAEHLPDGTVFDGDLVVFANEIIQPFHILQNRIGKKNLNGKILKEAPVAIIAFDLLEYEGHDIREKALIQRRQLLEEIVSKINLPRNIQVSVPLDYTTWEELNEKKQNALTFKANGLMLKPKNSAYLIDGNTNTWVKWKTDAQSIDSVLLYAQRGSGRMANLYTEYTFGVWKDTELISLTKAKGLSLREIVELDTLIKQNTLAKFGPVCTVKPLLVFEIGFEGIQESPRHKSGISLRSPHIISWRKDKKIESAGKLEDLKKHY